MRAIPTILAAGLCVAASSAQAVTIPDSASSTEGTTSLLTDWRGANRYQVIYSAAILTRIHSMTVREIQMRPDGGNAFPARSLFVTVTMSSRGVPCASRRNKGAPAALANPRKSREAARS